MIFVVHPQVFLSRFVMQEPKLGTVLGISAFILVAVATMDIASLFLTDTQIPSH